MRCLSMQRTKLLTYTKFLFKNTSLLGGNTITFVIYLLGCISLAGIAGDFFRWLEELYINRKEQNHEVDS